jgi:tetratricopeptide (TPR) repeat protein
MTPDAWSREEIFYVAERGYRLYREGRLRDAAILFEGLAAVDPEGAYCRRALSAISLGLGQYAAAVRYCSALLARNQFDAGALAGRCEALAAMGDIDAARRDLETLLAIPEGAPDARRLQLQFSRWKEST